MENSSRSPTTNLEDVMLVAFLVLQGHKIKPWRDTDDPNHISFDVVGDQASIEADMQKYYDNERVGVADFVRCLKETKSQMYNLKKLTNFHQNH